MRVAAGVVKPMNSKAAILRVDSGRSKENTLAILTVLWRTDGAVLDAPDDVPEVGGERRELLTLRFPRTVVLFGKKSRSSSRA